MGVPYPASLPGISQDSFGAKPAVAARYLTMDDGGRRPIRRWQHIAIEFDITFKFDWDQLAIFEAWWAYDLAMGNKPASLEVFPGVEGDAVFTDDYTVAWNNCWTVTTKCQLLTPAVVMPAKAGLPQWPSSLPELESGSYQYKQSGGTKTNIGEGPVTGRERFTRNAADIQAVVYLDSDQLTDFLTFVRDTLGGSVGWFSIPVAAGKGVANARTSLLDFNVQSMGAAYQVQLTLTTFQMPRISYLEYRYPNGLQISDKLKFIETVHYRHAYHQYIQEVLKYFGRMSRRYQVDEMIKFTADVRRHIALGTIEELLALIEEIGVGVSTQDHEAMHWAETVVMHIGRMVAEGLALHETVTTTTTYKRAMDEVIKYIETVERELGVPSGSSDSAGFKEHGIIRTDSYALDYFAEDYTNSIITF